MDTVDLHHVRDAALDGPYVPAPIGDIVRAASAGDVGQPWLSALPCRRRIGRRSCPGRIRITRIDPESDIRWRCVSCGDGGSVCNWADSLYDLRRRGLHVTEQTRSAVVDNDTAELLRGVQALDPDCQRRVFAMRTDNDHAVLWATVAEFDELLDAIAAEANHEASPLRRHRLDVAFDALSTAVADR